MSDDNEKAVEKKSTEKKQAPEFSFFAAIKSVISHIKLGTDVTRIALPSCFCVPYSLLQLIGDKRARGMETIRDIPSLEDPLARMIAVARWYSCSITHDEFGKKPLNSVLGETFVCEISSCPGATYWSEQVSHHPPISAFRFKDPGSKTYYEGTLEVRTKFHGNSVSANWFGEGDLFLPSGEKYSWSRHYPPLFAKGLIFGARRMETDGDVQIDCPDTGLTCVLKFGSKEAKVKGESKYVYTIKGSITKKGEKKPLAGMVGICNGQIHLQWPKGATKPEMPFVGEDDLLIDMDKVPVPELIPIIPEDEEAKKKFSTIVWKETIAALEDFDFDTADVEKQKVEEFERAERTKLEEAGEEAPPPRLFDPVEGKELVWTLKDEHRSLE